MSETSSNRPEDLSPHPDVERWLAYHRGELPSDDEEALREHFVACPECVDLVQAVAAFDTDPHDAVEGGEVRDLSTAASWRLLRRRLGKTEGSKRRFAPRQGPRWLVPLAASLLAALVGLSGWTLYLSRELAMLQQPTVNPVTLYLGDVERAAGETTALSAPGPWTLILDPPLQPGTKPGVYRLELLELSEGEERRLHEAEGLTLDETFTLTWLLPEGLPAGRYRIDLSAREDEDWQRLEGYLLRVEPRAEERATGSDS